MLNFVFHCLARAEEPEVTEADIVVSHVFTVRLDENGPRVTFWGHRRFASPDVLEYFIPVVGQLQADGAIHYVVPPEFEAPFSELVVSPQHMYAVATPYDNAKVTMAVAVSKTTVKLGQLYAVQLLNWTSCQGSGCPPAWGI